MANDIKPKDIDSLTDELKKIETHISVYESVKKNQPENAESLGIHLENLKEEMRALTTQIEKLQDQKSTQPPIATTIPKQPKEPAHQTSYANISPAPAKPKAAKKWILPLSEKNETQIKIEKNANDFLLQSAAKKQQEQIARNNKQLKKLTDSAAERNKANIAIKTQQIQQTNEKIAQTKIDIKILEGKVGNSAEENMGNMLHEHAKIFEKGELIIEKEIAQLRNELKIIKTALTEKDDKSKQIQEDISILKWIGYISKYNELKKAREDNNKSIVIYNNQLEKLNKKIIIKLHDLEDVKSKLAQNVELGFEYLVDNQPKEIDKQLSNKRDDLNKLEKKLELLTSELRSLTELPTSSPDQPTNRPRP